MEAVKFTEAQRKAILGQIEVDRKKGMSAEKATKKAKISLPTYYQWEGQISIHQVSIMSCF